jgi:hypothetical protein
MALFHHGCEDTQDRRSQDLASISQERYGNRKDAGCCPWYSAFRTQTNRVGGRGPAILEFAGELGLNNEGTGFGTLERMVFGVASCVVAAQVRGSHGELTVQTPVMLRFGEMTGAGVFISEPGCPGEAVMVRSTKSELPVLLRILGPEAIQGIPEIGGAAC